MIRPQYFYLFAPYSRRPRFWAVALIDLVLPAIAGVHDEIKFGAIRLKVQEWRPVENVDAVKQQGGSLNPNQFDDAQADSVGTTRGPSRKNPTRDILKKRLYNELWFWCLMEMSHQVEMRKAGQILKTLAELREYFYCPSTAFGVGGLDWGFFGNGMFAVNDANGENVIVDWVM